MNGTLHVHVYKEGLLARLGHDLRLSVTRFEVALRDGRFSASFDVGSVRVDGAADGERVDPDKISDVDKRTIQASIAHDILHADQHPRVTVEGIVTSPVPGEVSAQSRITMNGRTMDEEIAVTRTPGTLRVNTVIVPSRWGVAPYRALAGALRLQDRWRVRLYLPWEPPLDELRGAEMRWVIGG